MIGFTGTPLLKIDYWPINPPEQTKRPYQAAEDRMVIQGIIYPLKDI